MRQLADWIFVNKANNGHKLRNNQSGSHPRGSFISSGCRPADSVKLMNERQIAFWIEVKVTLKTTIICEPARIFGKANEEIKTRNNFEQQKERTEAYQISGQISNEKRHDTLPYDTPLNSKSKSNKPEVGVTVKL